MSKKKQIEEESVVDDNQVTEIEMPPFPSKEEIIRDPAAYKEKWLIPADANLAWRLSELPRYFKQNDSVLFTYRLPLDPNIEFSQPLWYQVISSPREVEALESLLNAKQVADSIGLNIVN